MKGDFSRMTFDKTKHFLRVLMQQGRVQLDADWNEQVAIMLHYVQTLAADLIGPHGGPGEGFKIMNGDNAVSDFKICPGRYYVDGILCENDAQHTTYTSQLDLPSTQPLENGNSYLVYLDVWERHVTYIEDEDQHGDEPGIREVALDGPDTTTRTKVVWQVKIKEDSKTCPNDAAWKGYIEEWQSENRGWLRAKAKASQEAPNDPCITAPEAHYRGVENQLYRVEIHDGGTAKKATFKWSRDNGTVIFPIQAINGAIVTLENLGHDDQSTLHEGDWVEVVDDDYVLLGEANPLLTVEQVDRATRTVTLSTIPAGTVGRDPGRHPLLRRWNHKAGDPDKGGLEVGDTGAALIKEATDQNDVWLMLEDGIVIQFKSPESESENKSESKANTYRTGDYWLIPARTVTGDVEWPGSATNPTALPPHGVEHHYAPLAVVQVDSGEITECRRVFSSLTVEPKKD